MKASQYFAVGLTMGGVKGWTGQRPHVCGRDGNLDELRVNFGPMDELEKGYHLLQIRSMDKFSGSFSSSTALVQTKTEGSNEIMSNKSSFQGKYN